MQLVPPCLLHLCRLLAYPCEGKASGRQSEAAAEVGWVGGNGHFCTGHCRCPLQFSPAGAPILAPITRKLGGAGGEYVLPHHPLDENSVSHQTWHPTRLPRFAEGMELPLIALPTELKHAKDAKKLT